MIPTHVAGLMATAFYLASLSSHLVSLHEGAKRVRAMRLAMWLALPALFLHSVCLVQSIFSGNTLSIGLFDAGSLTFWAVGMIAWLASWRWPMANLLLILYPLSIVALLTAVFVAQHNDAQVELHWGIGLHILLSILAYCLLTIAAVQSASLAILIHQLKHRRFRGIVDMMPPLQTMEDLLFSLLWTGEVLLGLAILTGAIFIDNIFAQHLAHKTVLSIIAWIVFAILLWGRHQQGWRGITAIKWTLSGFVLLGLGYFGSKFVLEVLLNRPG